MYYRWCVALTASDNIEALPVARRRSLRPFRLQGHVRVLLAVGTPGAGERRTGDAPMVSAAIIDEFAGIAFEKDAQLVHLSVTFNRLIENLAASRGEKTANRCSSNLPAFAGLVAQFADGDSISFRGMRVTLKFSRESYLKLRLPCFRQRRQATIVRECLLVLLFSRVVPVHAPP